MACNHLLDNSWCKKGNVELITVSKNINMTITTNIELIQNYRSKVPIVANNANIVYLNSSFQPPMNTIVSDSIETYLKKGLFETNPKPQWIADCEIIRGKVANYLNATADDIVFTRDTTEGCNLFQRSLKFKKGDNVVLLRGEHPNQTSGWLGLTTEGLEVKFIEVDESDPTSYDVEMFKPYVDENTIAIGISSVMFHSGLLNNVKSICDESRPTGIHVLVDATQEAGYRKINVKELGVSAMAFGVHKGLSTPTGLGILYIDPTVLPYLKETSAIVSAGSLSNLESSLITPVPTKYFTTTKKFEHLNKAMIQCLAVGKYLDFLESIGIENVQSYLEDLGLYLRAELRALGIKILGPDNKTLRSSHSNAILLLSPEWGKYFRDNEVYISQYRCGVRVSLGLYNSKDDVDRFIKTVKAGSDSGLKM